MSKWLERDIAKTGNPCTFALVIGVSRYDYLPEKPDMSDEHSLGMSQASTPASSALRFAEWLRDEYNQPEAPLGSICLLLSASEAEKVADPHIAEIEAAGSAPTADNVKMALSEWYKDCLTNRDHVAILYISGHGIQNSNEGSIVLLQDFHHPDDVRILERAIDLQGVREGMSRTNAARRQFYFVDTCRTRPDLLKEFYNVTPGITIDAHADGNPDVSAVYFGASSGTSALGDPSKGTLFGYALLECLRGEAYIPSPDGSWVITQASLIAHVPSQVNKLAERYKANQIAKCGGEFIDTVFHVVKGRPSVALTVYLEPPVAAMSATAGLIDENGVLKFWGVKFDPSLNRDIPAGIYTLNVVFRPPNDKYKDLGLPLIVWPPSVTKSISVLR